MSDSKLATILTDPKMRVDTTFDLAPLFPGLDGEMIKAKVLTKTPKTALVSLKYLGLTIGIVTVKRLSTTTLVTLGNDQ